MSYVAVLRSSLKVSFSRKAWCSNLLLGRRGALHCRCSILSSIQSNILSPDNFNDNSSKITSSIIEIEDKDTRKGTIFIASFVQENLMQKESMKIDPFLFNKKLDKINFWKKVPQFFLSHVGANSWSLISSLLIIKSWQVSSTYSLRSYNDIPHFCVNFTDLTRRVGDLLCNLS